MTTSTIVQRLLWKDFRVLRTVWLMCGLGTMFLMLVLLVVAQSLPGSGGFSAGFWVFAIWIPPVYLLASAAAMFAGEREEGTLVWLSTLAPPFPSLFWTRVAFLAASGMLLQVWLSIMALALSPFDPHARNHLGEYAFVMSFCLVEALAWGLFWALQSSRPLNAILYAALTIVAVNTGSIALTEAFGYRFTLDFRGPFGNMFGYWGWGRCLTVAGVLAASSMLADRWLTGRPWDWEFVARWWAARRNALATATPAEPVESWQRVWQRWRWLEWQSLRSMLWVVVLAAVLSCVSILSGRNPEPGLAVVLCWLAPVMMGLAAWRGEQSHANFRMLAYRGVSPAGFWLNKFVLWLLASVASVAMIAGATAGFWQILGMAFDGRRWNDLAHSHGRSSLLRGVEEHALWTTIFYGVSLYTLSFLWSHLSRKGVVAFGGAFISAVGLIPWFVVVTQHRLPWFWFIVPIPLWLTWVSWRHLSDWWLERTGWRVVGLRTAELLLPPVILLSAAAGYRVWEVPLVDASHLEPVLPQPWDAIPQTNVSGWSRVVELVGELPPTPTVTETQETSAAASDASEPAATADSQSAEDDRASWRSENRAKLLALRDQVLELPVMLPEAAIWTEVARSRHMHWSAPVAALAQMAVEELDAGQPDESLKWLRASVRLYGARQFGADFSTALRLTGSDAEWRDALGAWASHPSQTAALLSAGLQAAAEERRFTDDGTVKVLTERAHAEEWNVSYWPWERARHQRLANVAASNRLLYLAHVRNGRRLPSLFPDERWSYDLLPNAPSRVAGWEFRDKDSAGMYRNMDRECPVIGLNAGFTSNTHTVESRLNANITVMAIVGHRTLHGELPESLYSLEPLLGPQIGVVIDPWTGEPFHYLPDGFPLQASEHPPTSLLRQPMIWSSGAWRTRVRVNNNQLLGFSEEAGLGYTAARRDDELPGATAFPIPMPKSPE